MSIKIMSACWDIDNLSHTQKIVLLSLADQANDSGVCWPSMSSTSQRCGLNERSARRVIAELESMGHLSRSFHSGRPTYYRIHPGHTVTPDIQSPRTQSTLTPDTQSYTPDTEYTDPGQRSQYNRKESSLTVIEPSVSASAIATANPKKRTLGSRLPTDWALPREWGNWALEKGLYRDMVILEAEKFRNHWIAKTGKDATKADWEATWRNWILRAAEKRSDNKTFFERTQDAREREADKRLTGLMNASMEELEELGLAKDGKILGS
jgi:hypothetical protein